LKYCDIGVGIGIFILTVTITPVLKNRDPSFPSLIVPYHARVSKRSATLALFERIFVENIFTPTYHFLMAKFL